MRREDRRRSVLIVPCVGGEPLSEGATVGKGDIGRNGLLNGKKGETLSSQTFTTDLPWIAQKATTDPDCVLYTLLAHHIDEELLWSACQRLDKNKTPGIDGQTAAEYAEDLLANLRDVHERLQTTHYRAGHISNGRGFRKKTEHNAQEACLFWKTTLSKKPLSSFWNRSSRQSSTIFHMVFDRDAVRITPCTRCET